MALMYDIVYDKHTHRHNLEFVNQQFDYLMGIEYDDASGEYKLNVSLEIAQGISRTWAKRNFDLEYWLGIAKRELPEQDKKFPNGPDENEKR